MSGYLATLVLTVAKVMLGLHPTNVFTVTVQPLAAMRVEQVQFGIVCVLLLCGAALLYLRRRAAGRSKRRFAALLVDSFGLALVTLAALSPRRYPSLARDRLWSKC